MAPNLTVDDFDPLVVYSNYDDWATPNPQDNPTWWNASADVTNSPWHQGGSAAEAADGSDVPLHRGHRGAGVVQLHWYVLDECGAGGPWDAGGMRRAWSAGWQNRRTRSDRHAQARNR